MSAPTAASMLLNASSLYSDMSQVLWSFTRWCFISTILTTTLCGVFPLPYVAMHAPYGPFSFDEFTSRAAAAMKRALSMPQRLETVPNSSRFGEGFSTHVIPAKSVLFDVRVTVMYR